MSMTARSRTEMYKLRELVHFLLHGAGASLRTGTHALLCYFCKKPLGDYADFETHGNAKGPKFDAEISIHHVDGDHANNEMSNKALCHRSCHKSHHRRQANEERAVKRALGEKND